MSIVSSSLKNTLANILETIQIRLASHHGMLLLAFLGLISGVAAGLVIVIFRLLVETIQAGLLPSGDPENYEVLNIFWRFVLPVIGGLIVGLLFHLISNPPVQVGMVHVLERLIYHEGHMPRKNLFMQFIGAAICIISGQSVGRETPSVQMGASISSLLGQWLRLPNNSIRTLVGCGTAAAVAAAFNTPLAGVVFAIEVVLMEYTIAGFIPIILATVSATVVSRAVYGSAPAFMVPPFDLHSLFELPYILIMGVVIGSVSAAFISLVQWTTQKANKFKLPFWQRTTLAGFCMGTIAMAVPGIMGIGYDTVNETFLGTAGLWLMLSIAICKVIATGIGAGLGIPAGLIGPTLVMGATAGGAFGVLAGYLPGTESSTGLYAMLGMGAMMGAVLRAPLAALIALLELTANPNIILPGMLAIVSATLTTKELFGKDSVFLTQLREMGLDYRNNPVAQSLRSIGVVAVTNRNFIEADRYQKRSQAVLLLEKKPEWIILTKGDETVTLLPAADLAQFLEQEQHSSDTEKTNESNISEVIDRDKTDYDIDLIEIPAKRLQAAYIHSQATLQEALNRTISQEIEALIVRRFGTKRIYGIVTRQVIEESYNYK